MLLCALVCSCQPNLTRGDSIGGSGRLERIRTKVHVLRKKFRAGWRAAEGAWVTAGNQIISSFSRAVGAPPPPHSASAHILDASAIFAASPLQSFLSTVGHEEGSKGRIEDSQHGEASGRDLRKKPQYRSPTKGGVRAHVAQRIPSHSTSTLGSAKSGSFLSTFDSGGDEIITGGRPTPVALQEVAGLLDGLPLTYKAYDHHSTDIEEAFDAIFSELAWHLHALNKEEGADREKVAVVHDRSKGGAQGPEAGNAKEAKHNKNKARVDGKGALGPQDLDSKADYRGAKLLKEGGHFLPEFLYLEDDQERLPAPVFKPYVHTQTKPKVLDMPLVLVMKTLYEGARKCVGHELKCNGVHSLLACNKPHRHVHRHHCATAAITRVPSHPSLHSV